MAQAIQEARAPILRANRSLTTVEELTGTGHGARIAAQLVTLKHELREASMSISQFRINERILRRENARLGEAVSVLSEARKRDRLLCDAEVNYDTLTFEQAMRSFERLLIAQAIRRAKGNKCKAARELGMHRNTVRRKVEELGIDVKAGVR
jgi:DNA-binding NtrC family response regulator